MDLQQIYDDIAAALASAGAVNIEMELKPKNQPDQHVKVFVAFDMPVAG